MKRQFILFLMSLLVFGACKTKDRIVAEVYHSKLYLSEVQAMIPDGVSEEDSIQFANRYIEDWIMEKIILHEAEKTLSIHEKKFDQDIERFKNNLLINAYYQKLSSDSTLFAVTDQELKTFMQRYQQRYTIEREIIKLNYVKLSKGSKLIEPVREILFNEDKRINEKAKLEKWCADSIEYFIEDHTWLYLDDIQNEFPINIQNSEFILTENKHLEADDANYHYIIVFLDYRNKRETNESNEEIAAARMMLMQQKKKLYIDQKIKELYQHAVEKEVVIR